MMMVTSIRDFALGKTTISYNIDTRITAYISSLVDDATGIDILAHVPTISTPIVPTLVPAPKNITIKDRFKAMFSRKKSQVPGNRSLDDALNQAIDELTKNY
jgi:hypothetical protein